MILFEPTLAAGQERGLVVDIETLHLDRGYDNGRICDCVAGYGIDDLIYAKKHPTGTAVFKLPVPLAMRWPVERTNSWLTNYGQMRRNTDRRIDRRLGQLALAIALILTIKLIDKRDRHSPTR